MRPMSKSQERRFEVQKDPKRLARVTKRHTPKTTYTRERVDTQEYKQ